MSEANMRSEESPKAPIAHIIDASGADGSGQRDGRSGRDGVNGEGGTWILRRPFAAHGSPGGAGENGRNGDAGANATEGGRVWLSVSGSPSALRIRGEIESRQDPSPDPHTSTALVRIDETVELDGADGTGRLLLRARGGSGGDGGHGGHGGKGGDGGKGLPNLTGRSADGGDGGRGGRGGDGGPGGNAGSGGEIVIRSTDPRLFVLLCTDVNRGEPGIGGAGGRGGQRGAGGAPGWRASAGRPGRRGADGLAGSSGRDGGAGRSGRVLWQVLDEAGQVSEQAERSFGLRIEGYRVRTERDDDIFEPGEAVEVHDLELHNPGGLTLPAGARLSAHEAEGLEMDESMEALPLPALAPGERRTIPGPLRARLTDTQTPSRNEALRESTTLRLRVTLLDRTLLDVDEETRIPVQHPVEVQRSGMPPRVVDATVTWLTTVLRNTSSAPLGPDGHAELRLALPKGLHLADEIRGAKQVEETRGAPPRDPAVDRPTATPSVAAGAGRWAYLLSGAVLPAMEFDSRAEESTYVLRLVLPEIAPGAEAPIEIALVASRDVAPYSTLPWAVELWLRDRPIEVHAGFTTVVPHYDLAKPPTPVLLVGSQLMSQTEHQAWARIFDTLRLPFATWDADLEPEAIADWPARHAGGLVVLPVGAVERSGSLPAEAIVRHFRPRKADPRPVRSFADGAWVARDDAGLLAWDADPDALVEPLFQPAPNVEPEGQAVYGTESLNAASVEFATAATLRRMRTKLARSRPSRRWRLTLEGDPRHGDGSARYLGVAKVSGLRLRAGHRLRVVPPENGGPIAFAALTAPAGFPVTEGEDSFVTPRAFSRAFCAVVATMPMVLKLHALRAVINMPPAWRLADPAAQPTAAGETYSVPEVVARIIAAELVWERRRPVHKMHADNDAYDPWEEPASEHRAFDESGMDASAAADADPAAMPLHEILATEILTRPERYLSGDGPRLLNAILERVKISPSIFVPTYDAHSRALRASSARMIALEIEDALRAFGAEEGTLEAEALAISWRTARDWEWITHPTE